MCSSDLRHEVSARAQEVSAVKAEISLARKQGTVASRAISYRMGRSGRRRIGPRRSDAGPRCTRSPARARRCAGSPPGRATPSGLRQIRRRRRRCRRGGGVGRRGGAGGVGRKKITMRGVKVRKVVQNQIVRRIGAHAFSRKAGGRAARTFDALRGVGEAVVQAEGCAQPRDVPPLGPVAAAVVAAPQRAVLATRGAGARRSGATGGK